MSSCFYILQPDLRQLEELLGRSRASAVLADGEGFCAAEEFFFRQVHTILVDKLFVFNKLEDKKAGDAVEIVLPDLEAQIFNNMMLNNGGNAQ